MSQLNNPNYYTQTASDARYINVAGDTMTGALTNNVSITDPLVIGGIGTTSTLSLRSTSGIGAAGADIIFQTGNNGATEVMRILNSGNVGIGTATPGYPLQVIGMSILQVPCVRAFNSVNQTITNATFTALALDSERFDNDAIHDPVTNNSRLTCKTAGKYQITGQIAFANNSTGLRIASIRLNGVTYISEADLSASVGTESEFIVTTLYDLAVNDYVELIVYQSSGGNLIVEHVANDFPEFMMYRVST